MRAFSAGKSSVDAVVASMAAETAADKGALTMRLHTHEMRHQRTMTGGRVSLLILTLLVGAGFYNCSVLRSLAQSLQTDETDLHALRKAEMEAELERQQAYYPGRNKDEEPPKPQEPEQTLNLLDIEVSGAHDLRDLLEEKEIPDVLFNPSTEVEQAFNQVVRENTSMIFACSWDTEQQEAEVEMKRGRFLGVSNNAIAFEVTTAEDDALFMMKMGMVDNTQEGNSPDKGALRFIKSETVLNTLLPEESPERLLTRGLVVPLAVGKIKNFPDNFPLNGTYDGTNTVALYPMFSCNLRYLIQNDLLVTHKAKMYFTVRLLSLVAWLHARGVIHLDVRPEHMLVTTDGHGFLAGLENSAPVDTMVKTKTLPGYVAPEMLQLRRRKLMASTWHVSSFEMDAWSTGYTIYEIWCGKPPLDDVSEANMLKIYRKNWGRPWDYSKCGRLPTIVVGLVDGLLAWEEDARLLPVEIFDEHLLEPED